MTSIIVKQLAQMTINQASLDKKLASFVLNKLSRRQLIEYVSRLKTLVAKTTVIILSEKPLDPILKKSLVNHFPNKKVVFVQEKIGDGIKAITNDTIIDLTISGYADQTIKQLKA